MQWKNKGHEFDDVWNRIKNIKGYYLFGAGDYGNQFYHLISDEINIKGYIDNDKRKQGQIFNDLEIKAFSPELIDGNIGIIVTVSQMQRSSIMGQLEKAGFRNNENYFIIEDFISIYYVYKYNKVYFSTISMLPSTVCNLNCDLCLNFNPYAEKPFIRSLDQIKDSIDYFFKAVDYIMMFHVSGGEPFLYPYLPDVLEYLSSEYGDRIGTLRTVTNGTVVPKDEIMERLKDIDFEVTVDDYREAVPRLASNFDKVMDKLDEYGVRHYRNYTDQWIDLAPMKTDYSDWSDDRLRDHFDQCGQSWQELRDGRIYMCNYSAYAGVAGINKTTLDEYYDLHTYTSDKAKELIEFRLGYSEKGYVSFCKKCRGFNESNQLVRKAAVQVKR